MIGCLALSRSLLLRASVIFFINVPPLPAPLLELCVDKLENIFAATWFVFQLLSFVFVMYPKAGQQNQGILSLPLFPRQRLGCPFVVVFCLNRDNRPRSDTLIE